jgi:hypothetical protein
MLSASAGSHGESPVHPEDGGDVFLQHLGTSHNLQSVTNLQTCLNLPLRNNFRTALEAH